MPGTYLPVDTLALDTLTSKRRTFIQIFALSLVAILGFFSPWFAGNFSTPRSTLNPNVFSTRDADVPCGVACLAIASRLLKQPQTVRDLRDILAPDPRGQSTMREMITACEKLGFAAVPLRISPGALRRTFHLPLIVHVHGNHWAVLTENDHDCLVLLDPPQEPAITTTESLSQVWDGTMIVLSQDQESVAEFLSFYGIK
jgi:ABC-type bacteriocin/lantibiotic exporter with double-glycine peptidase domain